jgi:hypothetical protein
MAKDFSICDLPEDALLKMFDSFIKEYKDKDYIELAKILDIPMNKTDKFRQLIDDLQMHNARSPRYSDKYASKKEPSTAKKK